MNKQIHLLLAICFYIGIANGQTSDTSFVDLSTLSNDFSYDIRYATANNFLKDTVYPCPIVLLRKEVALALIEANKEFLKDGYRIQIFDGYRPLDVQKRMWKIYPNAKYVANPYKRGSIHNRGGAVDLTLIDTTGKKVDMGTDFDYFGEKAHHNNTALPVAVQKNRKYLKTVLSKYGFNPIRTEWWHYNYRASSNYGISNFPFNCNQ